MATTAALIENSRQGINFQIAPCIVPGAPLSPNPRWGCGHRYDETPVGLVVYVRNDPVNLVDPDGRLVADPSGYEPWFLWGDVYNQVWPGGGGGSIGSYYYWDLEGIRSGINLVGRVQEAGSGIGVGGSNPGGGTVSRETGGGGTPAPITLLPQTTSALERATNAVRNADSECSQFLQSVIDALKIKFSKLQNMAPADLVNALKTPGVIEDNAPGRGHTGVAYTDNGVISLRPSAYTSYLYATLIHEAFHLFGPENEDLLSAMKSYQPNGWGPLPGAGDDRTGYVARYCGGM